MYTDQIHQGKKVLKISSLGLILLSVVIFLPFKIQAQNVDSLIETINHSTTYENIEKAKNKVPAYLQKVDLKLLDVVRQLKSMGITRINAAKNDVEKKFSTPMIQLDNQANFLVNIYLKELNEEVISKLNKMGITVQNRDEKYKNVTCLVPFDAIDDLAKDKNIQSICNVCKPHFNTDPYKTVGDQILSAVTARSSFGIDGTGIKVGVISDDADNYQNVINAGYLDASLFHYDYGDPDITGNEGTAMSEIVHVLAPKADIHFEAARSYGNFPYDINELASLGCNVIVDDVGFFDEPMFEDHAGAVRVDEVSANNGVTYISAAGNAANRTWNGMSVDANQNTWMEFSGSDETNAITVSAYSRIRVLLQWANKWNNAHDDFDIYLYSGPDPSSQVLNSGTNFQGGSLPPMESFFWVNTSASPQTVYLRIKLRNVSAAREVTMEVWDVPGPLSHVQGGHIWGHSAASSCISVGAINSSDGQTIENFSSIGSARIYEYDANGYPISFTERQAPTICGIDNVQTYIGNGTTFWYQPPANFRGTSAAAPHIAAIAALILQQNGTSLNWEQVKSILALSADKVPGMGGQNFTNVYGFGRSNAYTSCRNLYVPQVYTSIPSALSAAKAGQNVVITSGTYTMTSSLTVPSGKTLTINPGVTLQFANGISLISYGKLVANGATFTSTGSTSPGAWGLIQISSSSASYSSLSNCNIQYGTHINVINGANNVSIQNCSITNNSGHGINVSSSSNFSAANNTIANGNVNHGITISGGTNNRCSANIIYKLGGTSGYQQGSGIQYNSSSGVINQNDIENCNWGIGAVYGSTINSGWSYGSDHNNRITNSVRGLRVYQNSWCDFGKVVGGMDDGNGNNSIYGNTYNVEVGNNINDPNTVYACDNWWGNDPPQTSKFMVWPYSSTFTYSPWLHNNPWSQYPLHLVSGQLAGNVKYDNNMSIEKIDSYNGEIQVSSAINEAQDSLILGTKFKSQKKEAINYIKSYINKHPDNYAGYVVLYGFADSTTTPEIINFFESSNSNAPNIRKLLLGNLYQIEGNHNLAQKVNNDIISKNPNMPVALMAAMNNMRIELYNNNNIEAARVILDQIKKQAGIIDSVILADAELTFATYVDPKTGMMPNYYMVQNSGENNLAASSIVQKGLMENYPNPFNPSTRIGYRLLDEGNVTLRVYDILGREVATLVNENQKSGIHFVTFDGTLFASGIYFYRLSAPGINQVKKMLLTK